MRYLLVLATLLPVSCRTAGRSGGDTCADAVSKGLSLNCVASLHPGQQTANPAANGRGAAGVVHAEVRGNSLSPFINAGDSVEIYYGYYDTHEIQRGDIVVCRFSFRQDPVIKIVRAVPGDSFGFKDLGDGGALLLINGDVLENSVGRPYEFTGRRKRMLALYARDYKGVIPPDSYLLLGDAAEGSLDSGRFGLVDKEVIIGKAMRGSR